MPFDVLSVKLKFVRCALTDFERIGHLTTAVCPIMAVLLNRSLRFIATGSV